MLSLVQTERGVTVTIDELAPEPLLLNVENGTLGPRTFGLRPRAQANLITKLTPAGHDQGAECPTWLRLRQGRRVTLAASHHSLLR